MATRSRFKEFTLWLKSGDRQDLASATVTRLYRAHARHRVARRFQGLRRENGSDSLIRGYSEGLRLFLSYSAAEAFGNAIGHHITRWTICDPSLAPPLRKLSKPLAERPDVIKGTARSSLIAFLDSEHDNIRVVATALRHLVAHGDFTPTGAGVMTKQGAESIRRLADHMLVESDRQFAVWFARMAGK